MLLYCYTAILQTQPYLYFRPLSGSKHLKLQLKPFIFTLHYAMKMQHADKKNYSGQTRQVSNHLKLKCAEKARTNVN